MLRLNEALKDKKSRNLLKRSLLFPLFFLLGMLLAHFFEGFRYNSAYHWLYFYGNMMCWVLFIGIFVMSFILTIDILFRRKEYEKALVLPAVLITLLPILYIVFLLVFSLF